MIDTEERPPAAEDLTAWGGRARDALVSYLANSGVRGAFMTEQVRKWAEERGLPVPPDRRSWGAIMSWGAKLRLIEKAGFGVSEDKIAHCRPSQLWRRRAA